MLKPPFTVIIIKKTHEPLTIQVTPGLILSLIILFFLLCTATGLGISILFSRGGIPYWNPTSKVTLKNKPASEQFLVSSVSADDSTEKESSSTGIENLSIIPRGKNNLGIMFSFSNVASHEIVYVWLIVNPDAETAGEMVIYPRNPVFKGIPVDYRNGFAYRPSIDMEVRITFSDLISDINFKNFRILAYSADGKVLVDNLFNIKELNFGKNEDLL